MWAHPAFTCIQPIFALVLIAICFVYWSRSKRRGFMWIGAAYLLLVAMDLLQLLISLVGVSQTVWALWAVPLYFSRIAFLVLILSGLHSFYAECRVVSERRRTGPIRWQDVSLVVRRVFFIATGAIFVLVGPFVALSNRSSIGVGCVTAVMGVACLWLGLHSRSPLAKSAAKNGETTAGPGQTSEEQEPREDTQPLSGDEPGVDPKEEIP